MVEQVKQNARPNTFIIGVQKSGTSTIHSWLKQHQDVCAPEAAKDFPLFLDKHYADIDFYLRKLYQASRNEKIIMNGYAHYLFHTDVAKRIRSFDPNAKLILLLRKPSERILSSFLFARKRQIEKLTSLEEALDRGSKVEKYSDELNYLDHSFYFRHIDYFLKIFSIRNLKVILFEDLKSDPVKVYDDLCEFLGIDHHIRPDFKAINKTGKVRFSYINKFLYREYKLKKLLSKALPVDLKVVWRRKIMRWNTTDEPGARQVLDESTKFKINNLLEKDIRDLEQFLERDLSSWFD